MVANAPDRARAVISRRRRGPLRRIAGALAIALTAIAAPLAARANTQSAPIPRPVAPGYYVDSVQAIASRPAHLGETTGDFTYTIRREFPDSTGERLLGIAEATYPPRELLSRIAAEEVYEIGSDTLGVPLWWCRGVGENRVPYAITVGALDHYVALTRSYRERWFPASGTRPLFWSDLTYRATIGHRDRFKAGRTPYANVYVAHLTLVWSHDDGTFLPTTRCQRVVVLSPAGAVLAVGGDGEAEEDVSISTKIGIGRQERLVR